MGENNVRGVIRLVTILKISCSFIVTNEHSVFGSRMHFIFHFQSAEISQALDDSPDCNHEKWHLCAGDDERHEEEHDHEW